MGNHSNSNKVTAGSLLIALGIIYGDIGTSPLYVLKAIIGEKEITEMLVFGGVSCVFWTLMFQTTLKYITLTLMADNNGEGGVFSLYALVKRFGGNWLVIPTILGATALLADGIITPPISVASAVEGLEKVMPHLPIVPIVIVILSIIFFFQRFGTNMVGSAFGPIMVLWFVMLFALGLGQIIYYPSIIKALNPYYAYDLLAHYPQGFWLLGGVFLCTTGAEALYSDLGHCGRPNIRITWIFVKISLIVNYLGQSSWLLLQEHGKLEGRNPFYEIMPEWFLVIGIIIATLATVIASQALITGSYTLISEAMSLNFWPRVAVRHPSDLKGQIYIPSVNTLLWVGCVLMILYFENSTNMEAAYGFSITVAMIMTTVLLSFFLYYVRHWNIAAVAGIFVLFIAIEISFFVANFPKLLHNPMGLVPIFLIAPTMFIWYYARKINNKMVKFVDINAHLATMDELSKDDGIDKFATHLIYLTKSNEKTDVEERILKSIFAKKPKRADVYWLLHLNRTDDPYTLSYEVNELLDDKVIRVDINIGFRVQPLSELYFKMIVRELVRNQELNLHIRPDGSTKYNPEPDFKFIVTEKFLSVENKFKLLDGILLNGYFFLKKLSQSDQEAFGLEKSDVILEKIPLVYQPIQNVELHRITNQSTMVNNG